MFEFVLVLLGVLCIAGGVLLLYGAGVALIVFGVLLIIPIILLNSCFLSLEELINRVNRAKT